MSGADVTAALRVGVLLSLLLHGGVIAVLSLSDFPFRAAPGGSATVTVRLVMSSPAFVEPDVTEPLPAKQSRPQPVASLPEQQVAADASQVFERQVDLEAASRQQQVSDPVKQTSSRPEAGQSGKPVPAASQAQQSYLALLARQINQHKFYPASARRLGEQGRVLIGFVIQRDGRLEALRVVKSSGYPQLDQAALDAVRSASPFRPIPASFNAEKWPVKVPIEFSLH